MANLSGDYNFSFSRLEPMWDNANQTGISSLVVGLQCSFSGVDQYDNSVQFSEYVDGVTGFSPIIDYDQLSGNIEQYANEMASGMNWWDNLVDRIDSAASRHVRMPDFIGSIGKKPHPTPPEYLPTGRRGGQGQGQG